MDHPVSIKINILSNLIHRRTGECVSASIPSENKNYTATNAKVIGYLMVNSEKDVFQKDIEEALQLRRSTVSTLLQGMEKKGFVTREAMAFDARVKKIVPTPQAIHLHGEIVKELDKFERQFTKDISEQEMQAFLSILEKLQKNIAE